MERLDAAEQSATEGSPVEQQDLLTAELVAASQPFVGQWNRLVSTTNWDKGRIILDWRQALLAQEAIVTEYSDEAWARLVGGVTGQHVGRLRRVFQRFGATQQQYAGLFWSHFQAALDWTDAEMWLEGAVQQNWSVSRMREQRWETLGAVAADKPRSEDVVTNEKDEDFEPARNQKPEISAKYEDVNADVTGPRHEGSDFGDEGSGGSSTHGAYADRDQTAGTATAEPIDLVRPFANLPELPDDLNDALEQFKLAILHHKTDGWKEVGLEDVLRSLDALKVLATAPSPENAPF
ncbi:hypothetical protein ETAA8_38770 [Anatilimnocola aggregata]|uniref:Uncharacterized protein n=1 Tax=Anatilimnocola aggregata TaxID=2528021 RepID=A0A517YF46_9BACT|nr:hypothetical protein [Anatilimnocola aggregata]QDU28772.1 hypothetical protein ETAA8_38770 [Anatilimnocola aggregata]